MSFKLFTIGWMYSGYLDSFYQQFGQLKELSYEEHNDLLIKNTTEFTGSYIRTFRKLGIEARCVIANDSALQNKWRTENGNRSYNHKKILFEQVKNFQPEILIIESLGFTDNEWLDNVRENVKSIKLIIAYHCSPISPKIFERLKSVDFVITCTPGLKQIMEERGCRAYLVYHGFDADLLDRINEENTLSTNKIIFSGSLYAGGGYHSDRIELLENLLKAKVDIDLYVNLEKKLKIRIKQLLYLANKLLKKLNLEKIEHYLPVLQYGVTPVKYYSDTLIKKKHRPVFGIEMLRLFSRSYTVLNFHAAVAGDYAGNMRLFEVTGVGSCLLTDYKSNLNDLFEAGKELVVYNSIEDCIAKARWLNENEDERKKIALAGHQRTLNFHKVEDRCRSIIEIISKELEIKFRKL